MNVFQQKMQGFKREIKQFHTKKPQLEFFTALLSIPVLLTVILLNFNNLKGDNSKNPTNPTPIIINQSSGSQKEVVVTKAACKVGLGSVSIDNPQEGDSISDNPVSIDISYSANGYCDAVWSYRINGGSWSEYDNRSIALYNLPNGNIKFELRVKSVVNKDQKNLTRNFTYSGGLVSPTTSPTPTITPTPSS